MQRLLIFLSLLMFSGAITAQDCHAVDTLRQVVAAIRAGQPQGINKRITAALVCADDTTQLLLWQVKYLGYRNRGKERSALRAIRSGEALLRGETPQRIQLNYLISLAEGHLGRREWAATERYLAQAEAMMAEGAVNASENDRGRYYYVSGKMYRGYWNDLGDGETAYQQALAHFQKAVYPDVYVQGKILRDLGNGAQDGGDYALCREYRERELSLYQLHYPVDHADIAIAYYNLGGIFYRLADHQASIDAFMACHLAWEQKFNHPQQFKTMLHEAMGDMYWAMGKSDDALVFYDLSTSRETTVNRDSSELFREQADSLLAAGEYTGALANYQDALAFRQTNFGQSHRLTISCQNYMAEALGAAGQGDKALRMYHSSIALLQGDEGNSMAAPAVPQLLTAMAGKGELLLRQALADKDPALLAAAAASLDSAVHYLDALLLSPMSENAKSFWNRQSQRLIEQAIRAHVQLSKVSGAEEHIRQALQLSEKGKGFLLAAGIQGSEAVAFAGIPPEVTEAEQHLRQQLLHYEAKFENEEKRCADVREKQLMAWGKKREDLQIAYQQILGEIKTKYPDFFNLKYQAGAVDINDLQRHLGEQETALIEFYEGRETVFVFLLNKQENKVWEVPITEQYRGLVEVLSSLPATVGTFLETPSLAYEQYGTSAHELYELLLQPVLRDLPADHNRLLLVPGGSLARVPFGSLLSEFTAGQKRDYRKLPYLIRQYAISYAPSAGIWSGVTAESGKRRGGTRYAGFAPDYDELQQTGTDQAAALPQAREEVAYGRTLFSGQVFLGSEATEKALRTQSADLLHLAGHAYLDEEAPLRSRLLLHPADSTEDGWLHAYEIYGLSLPTEICLLSACHTAAGPIQGGEGTLSLERAFHYAGSAALLSTQWAAEDGASTIINRYFLAHLQEGLAKDVALQQAQLRYLSEAAPGFLPPFYWAGLRLSGSSVALQGGGWTWWAYAGLGVVGLVVVGGIWYRRG